jgi:transcriptional regulator of NAD metabolism
MSMSSRYPTSHALRGSARLAAVSESSGVVRRERIVELLREGRRSITGSELSSSLGVSRQAIVNDIAILRAAGRSIGGSAQGYRWQGEEPRGVLATLDCRHDREGCQKELETLVAHGVAVLDVVVDHALYGEVRADLNVWTHRDVQRYMEVLHTSDVEPLSALTGGVHTHHVRAPDDVALRSARSDLALLGFLLDD